MQHSAVTTAHGRAIPEPAADAQSTPTTGEMPPQFTEDWLAVLVGAALVALVRPTMPSFVWGNGTATLATLVSAENLARSAQMATLVLLPLLAGAIAMRARLLSFVAGLLALYLLAWLAQAMAGHTAVSAWGLEYVIFGLAIGLLINHAVGLPAWLREAVRTEYFIKAGLVVLGAAILFDDIVGAGLIGIIQALVVVISVWTFCFWLARRMKVDDEFATMLASAVSICGVSAAIAACGAIQGDKKKLSPGGADPRRTPDSAGADTAGTTVARQRQRIRVSVEGGRG